MNKEQLEKELIWLEKDLQEITRKQDTYNFEINLIKENIKTLIEFVKRDISSII